MPYGDSSLSGRPIYDYAGYTEDEWNALSEEERSRIDSETRMRIRRQQGNATYAREHGQEADYIPFAGGNAAEREARAQQIERGFDYGDLYNWLPGSDNYATYDEEGLIAEDPARVGETYADEGSIAAQRDALRALQDVYSSGGMTTADRARQRMAQMETGRAMRASREADEASLQARGIAGGGASIASMLGAQSGGANSLAMQDASMLQDAQRRALQAMQAAGGLSTQQRGQSFEESRTRNRAIDEANQRSTDYLRSREGRRVERDYATQQGRAGARQQEFANRMGIVQGRHGQDATALQGAMAGQQSREQGRRDMYNAFGSALSFASDDEDE